MFLLPSNFVQSTYKASWRGYITWEANEIYGLNCIVVPFIDQHGNKIKRRIPLLMGKCWLKQIEPFDTSDLNLDWLLWNTRTQDEWKFMEYASQQIMKINQKLYSKIELPSRSNHVKKN